MGAPVLLGTTGLTYLGDRRDPERIYVARTVMAALGLYQQDGLSDHALICGLDVDSPETVSAFVRVVARHPSATVHLAIDARENDGEEEAFEARVIAALHEVRLPEARVTVRRSVSPELYSSGSHTVSADPISDESDRERRRDERTRQDRKSSSLSPTR